ncbi:hypothetical protein ACQ4PT_022645 [Festuca glaucescens]
MSPSHSRHSPPALSDDDIVSIFLRIPSDDPALLVRASLVCKAWRRILTGPRLLPPLPRVPRHATHARFILNFWSRNSGELSRFIPTTAFRLSSGIDSTPLTGRSSTHATAASS